MSPGAGGGTLELPVACEVGKNFSGGTLGFFSFPVGKRFN